MPSGASTGEFEAVELRDGGERLGGKGVDQAVANVNGELAEAVQGLDPADQAALDRAMIELDGTPNKGRLGANAILGVSLAAAKAAAAEAGLPLWRYLGRRGRARAAGADDERAQRRRARRQQGRLPGVHGRAGRRVRRSPRRCALGAEVFHALKSTLHDRGLSTAVGDEGGFAPDLDSNEAALEVLIAGIEAAGYRPGEDVAIALDPATSEIFDDGAYVLEHEGRTLSLGGDGRLLGRHGRRATRSSRSRTAWTRRTGTAGSTLTERLGERVQLVGDDLFVTNTERLERGIEPGVANSILVKVNQIGTLTETLDAVAMAREAGYTAVMSHRSGETEDTTIADLAVATGCGQIKTGRAVTLRSGGQVQPAAADRGGAAAATRPTGPRFSIT